MGDSSRERNDAVVAALRTALVRDDRLSYVILFGSTARRSDHAGSDLDVGIGLRAGTSLTGLEVGHIIADLERATGRTVDLVLLDEAPPALAYRAFRDGVTVIERDHQAFVTSKVKAIRDYLDFRPLQEIAIRGALAAAARGR